MRNTDYAYFNGAQLRANKTGHGDSAAIRVAHGTSNKEAAVFVKRTDTDRSIELVVGQGGVNRGLYIADASYDGWLMYYDDSKIYFSKPVDVTNLPDASTSARGLVSTGGQTFAGRKGFGYTSSYAKNDSGTAVRYADEKFIFNAAGTQIAERWYDCGDATNITTGQFCWREFSPNSTPDTATTGSHETYKLPVCDSGRTTSVNYNILTTKSAVTVAQGGTGGTTAAGARSNLSIITKSLKASVGTTETLVSTSVTTYQDFIITGKPGTTANVSTIVPRAALSSTATTWQIDTESNYIMFTMRIDGSNLYVQVTGPSGTSKTISVYGVYGA